MTRDEAVKAIVIDNPIGQAAAHRALDAIGFDQMQERIEEMESKCNALLEATGVNPYGKGNGWMRYAQQVERERDAARALTDQLYDAMGRIPGGDNDRVWKEAHVAYEERGW